MSAASKSDEALRPDGALPPEEAPHEDTRARLAEVYRDHAPFVHRSARRIGVPDHLVEDIVQDVFLVVARRLETFEGRSDLRTWLFAILMRVIRQHRRTQWRHLRRKEALAECTAVQPRHDDQHGARDSGDLLLRLLEELDEQRRAIFVLSELEGMTALEIAEALEVNVNTVYTRLRAARKALASAAVRLGLTKEERHG